MKLAISAFHPKLDSEVDPRFGRCPFFILLDTETMEWRGVENSDAAMPSGAGVGAARFVAGQGAEAVITGVVGPKAAQVLEAGDIQVFTVSGGTVSQAVESFKAGTLEAGRQTSAPPAQTGWGQGGRGRGMGGGRGCGMGRGPGSGMGRGPGGGRRNW